MTTIENKTRYYLIDLHRGNQQIREFVSEEDLIDWLSYTTSECYHWWESEKIKNRYLEEIALSVNDTMDIIDAKTLHSVPGPRRYMFYDSYYRIIDARMYWEEAKKRYLQRKERRESRLVPDDVQYGDVLYKYRWWNGKPEGKYLYRCGPVPNTRCWRGGKHYYRHPQTTNEFKKNTDPDYKQYVRAKRRHLPTTWDDIRISSNDDRSWKNCTKKKKQWM